MKFREKKSFYKTKGVNKIKIYPTWFNANTFKYTEWDSIRITL